MSASAHMLIFAALGFMPSTSEVLARHIANFEIVEPPPPPEPQIEPPEPEPEPEEPEPRKVVQRAAAAEPEPEPEPEQAPQPAAAPVDFSGVTLTGGDGSWSTVVGDGSALKGPVGKIPTRQPDEAPGPRVEKAAPRVVNAKALSRRPEQPGDMDAKLQRNYPRRARMQGVEGNVTVNVKIMPDGRVASLRVKRESPDGWGFADACVKTLRGAGRWRPPLDGQGKPVATVIPFPCRFEVQY